MGLSSNIIWHQTNFDGLKAILHSKCFQCSYSLEDIQWKSHHLVRAFPMISFCNIPISDLSEYLKNNQDDKYTGKYGKYTIGLKQSWYSKQGLAPVWYLNQQSLCLQEIMKHHHKVQDTKWEDENILVWNLLSHIKNFKGSLEKYGFKSYRFYDEREVRYVPPINSLTNIGVSPVLSKKEYEDYKKEHKKSSCIDTLALSFEIKDIAYILVSSLSQKKRILTIIGNEYNDIVFMSYNQIIEDIIGLSHNRQ